MKNQKVDNRITLKEFRELHKNRKSGLTPYEKYRIISALKSPIEENILIHLYTKFLNFNMKEFHQRKFDIQIGIGSYAEITINRKLKSLEEKGYITQEFKQVKNKQYSRVHFNINLEKMNEFLTVGDDLKPENFSNLIESLRRQNEVVKPNPFDTTNKKDTPKVETTDNEHTPIKPAVEPIILKRPEKGENVRRAIQKELSKQKEQEKKSNPTVEPIEEHTEPIDNDNKTIEIINNKNGNNAIMKETNTDNDDNIELNEKARLILKYKDYEGVKPVLKDLMLSTETINELCSDDYKIGLNEKLDDKKATLDILFDVFIKGIIKKENG